MEDFKEQFKETVEIALKHNKEVYENQKRKPLNRDACYKTGAQILAAGTRRLKTTKKHIDKLGNEELSKELNRLIYEQEKFHKELIREMRKEQKHHDR